MAEIHLNQFSSNESAASSALPVAAKIAFATAGATGGHLVRLRRLDFRARII